VLLDEFGGSLARRVVLGGYKGLCGGLGILGRQGDDGDVDTLERPLAADPIILRSSLRCVPVIRGSRWTWTPSRVSGLVLSLVIAVAVSSLEALRASGMCEVLLNESEWQNLFPVHLPRMS
jgi:hypothetical protein